MENLIHWWMVFMTLIYIQLVPENLSGLTRICKYPDPKVRQICMFKLKSPHQNPQGSPFSCLQWVDHKGVGIRHILDYITRDNLRQRTKWVENQSKDVTNMTDNVLGLSILRSLGFKQLSQGHLDIQFDAFSNRRALLHEAIITEVHWVILSFTRSNMPKSCSFFPFFFG